MNKVNIKVCKTRRLDKSKGCQLRPTLDSLEEVSDQEQEQEHRGGKEDEENTRYTEVKVVSVLTKKGL